jgi:hypothetical protein
MRIAALMLAAMALAAALAGCGAEAGAGGDEHAGHAGHADHAASGATGTETGAAEADAADSGVSGEAGASDTSAPAEPAPEEPAYTLEAEVEQREDGFYLLVSTNLKLSKDNYGRSPVEGEGHIHLYVNGSLIGPITDFEPVLLRNLREGENVVRVELAQNNHSVIPGTSRTVRFENAPLSGSPAPSDTGS